MRTVLDRLAVGAFALSAAVFGLAAPVHAAAATGSISGHVTDASGAPAAGVSISVTSIDMRGVEFDSPDGTAQQYAAGKKTFEPVPRHAGDGHGWLGDRVQPGAD